MEDLPRELLSLVCWLTPETVMVLRTTCRWMRDRLENAVDKSQTIQDMVAANDVAGMIWYTTNALASGKSGVSSVTTHPMMETSTRTSLKYG